MRQPKILRSLKAFRYGVSFKTPNGEAYDPARCGKIITHDSDFRITWQCGHKNGKGRHGLWCSKHAMEIQS